MDRIRSIVAGHEASGHELASTQYRPHTLHCNGDTEQYSRV